jgi:hypothetical protein
MHGRKENSVQGKGKKKGKFRPITGHDSPEGEERYISTLSLTSSSDLGWVVKATPLPLYPRERDLYPLYRRLSEPQRQCGRVRKISPPPGFDPRTAHPVASRYTDSAMPVHNAYTVC